MSHWLTQPLAEKIKLIFEDKYKRKLTNEEIIDIADNLTNVMEIIIGNKIENGV